MFTRDFLTEAWALLFAWTAAGLHEEHWKLDESDARELSDRTLKLVRTIDKKKLAQIEKKYGKYVPAISLATCVVTLTGTRVKTTLALRRQRNGIVSIETRNGTRPAPSSASGPTGVAPADLGNRNGHTSANGNEPVPPAPFVTRPVRRTDGDIVDRESDA